MRWLVAGWVAGCVAVVVLVARSRSTGPVEASGGPSSAVDAPGPVVVFDADDVPVSVYLDDQIARTVVDVYLNGSL